MSDDADLDLEAELMAAMGGDEDGDNHGTLSSSAITGEEDEEVDLATRKAAQAQIDKALGLTSGKALVEAQETKQAAKRKRAESDAAEEGEEGEEKKKAKKKKKKEKESDDKKVRFDGETEEEDKPKKKRPNKKKKEDKDKDKEKEKEKEKEKSEEKEVKKMDQEDEEEREKEREREIRREEEEDQDEDLLNELMLGTDEKMISMDTEAGQQRIKSLLSTFTPAQSSRYESYRTSQFQPSTIKKVLASHISSSKISNTAPLVVGAVAKLFVGRLIEQSRQLQLDWKQSGPLRPHHIREAYRRMQQQQITSTTMPINHVMNKRLFRR